MAIYEIILCILILLVSVLVCAVTLSMDKADKNSLSVITGMSYETVMTAAKIIATAHPIARGVCKCDTPADVSFKDVASTLLDSGWESVLIADKNLLIANTDVARNDYVNAHPKSKFTIYRRKIDKHGIPRKVTEVWG